MPNPFKSRVLQLSGPAYDIVPVVPNDSTDLAIMAVGLYCETAGTVAFISAKGTTRTVAVPALSILPVGVRRVLATGTTATGLHALVVE